MQTKGLLLVESEGRGHLIRSPAEMDWGSKLSQGESWVLQGGGLSCT